MNTSNRWYSALTVVATVCSLVACGGGGGGSTAAPTPTTPAPPVVSTPPPAEPGSPASVGNIAIDGRNWINFRRSQIGIPVALTVNALIDKAAQAHSDYQKANGPKPTHDEVAGTIGFTGVDLPARLDAAGYRFGTLDYAYGEVIAATSSNSGFFMAEELITAIYHRFVIFEPMFKEIGTGSATNSNAYTFFTADFTANNGFGPGITKGQIVTWPFNGQTSVTPNFFSDTEEPDPIPTANEVGYPISVHANINAVLNVTTFSIRPRGGADLSVSLIKHYSDLKQTVLTAAAVVPLLPLKAATIYEVTFIGTVDAVPITQSWSFTTK